MQRTAISALLLCVAGGATAGAMWLNTHRSPEPAPGPAPSGMVWVPGGTRLLGDNKGPPDEQPAYIAHVKGFWLDRTPVTVAEFAAFAKRTGYESTADKLGSGEVMQFGTGEWRLVEGADWRHPFGPKDGAAIGNHPVTQVSWFDANAFCGSEGRRLPTEAEWEYAARYGYPQKDQFAFGPHLIVHGKYQANVWTGQFPTINTAADGYKTTSPVGAFGHDKLGLSDMAGNVWEWSANWYRSYADRSQPFRPNAESQKSLRGGSFLCNAHSCFGYRVAARSHSTPNSALMNVGFRCAASASIKPHITAMRNHKNASSIGG